MSDDKNENEPEVNEAEDTASVQEDHVEDAVLVELDPDETPDAGEAVDDPQPEQPDATVETPPARSSGVLRLLVDCVVAGAIGFGVATYLNVGSNSQTDTLMASLSSQVEAQSLQIDGLVSEISRVEGLVDTTALTQKMTDLSTKIDTRSNAGFDGVLAEIETLSTAMAALEARILDVEKRPMAESISPDAISAYETEMTDLRAAIAAHRADIESMTAEARALEASARADAIKSEGTNWVTEISVAIANGQPFAAPLTALRDEGVDIADVLMDASVEGVSTQSELAAAFPDYARLALAAVRSAETEGDAAGGIMTFLQNQLGVRSVSPRDGDSADAVLSRAEAAAQAGDVASAMAELDALPEVGMSAMADWVALANQRTAVEMARDALKNQIVNK